MAMAVAGLEYILRLNDMMSSPLKGVMEQVDDLGRRGKEAMIQIGAGAAGLVATGMALANALSPAIDMSRAIGEVKSLGVAGDNLNTLKNTALEFTSAYGGAATDFVRSAYDIQSAIQGLDGKELAAFTEKSSLLAKGTKASAATITNYMGTMYGIFANEAKVMGNAQWVDKIAGQTALAVKKFKTSGDGMSSAFTSLSAAAKSAGIDTAEQFAILGNLQATMSGSEAGTKYKAFLAGVGGAQKALNLSFVDSNGNMLDMITILNKIKGKFGDTLDVAEAGDLKKAFGSEEAVALIKLLLPKVNELNSDITELANVTNTDELAIMATAMVDPWQKLSATVSNIKTAIGGEILKLIAPIADKIAALGKAFVKWLNTYKNIARWIGYIVGALIGLTGLTAAITLFAGAVKAIGIAFAAITGPIGLVVAGVVGLGVLIYTFRDQFASFFKGFIAGWQQSGASFKPIIAAFGSIWQSLQVIWQAVSRLFRAIFGGTEGMNSFTSAGEVFGFIVGSAFGLVADAIAFVASLIADVAAIFSAVANIITRTWQSVIEGWKNSDPLEIFGALATGVTDIFSTIFSGIKNMFIKALNWIIEKANSIGSLIGIEIPLIPVMSDIPKNNAVPKINGVVGANDVPVFDIPAATEIGANSLVGAAQMAIAIPIVNSNNLALADSVKPPQAGKIGDNASNKIATTNNNNNSINISKIEVNANNMDEILKTIKERQALAN